MRKLFNSNRWFLFISLVFVILLLSSMNMAQEKPDEELKKTYAPILGDYEFDLTSYGGGVIILKIHVESGNLWGDSGDGKPIILEPVEDREFEFTADDPDSGALEIKFIKKNEGEYTICHVALLDESVEIDGIKIK